MKTMGGWVFIYVRKRTLRSKPTRWGFYRQDYIKRKRRRSEDEGKGVQKVGWRLSLATSDRNLSSGFPVERERAVSKLQQQTFFGIQRIDYIQFSHRHRHYHHTNVTQNNQVYPRRLHKLQLWLVCRVHMYARIGGGVGGGGMMEWWEGSEFWGVTAWGTQPSPLAVPVLCLCLPFNLARFLCWSAPPPPPPPTQQVLLTPPPPPLLLLLYCSPPPPFSFHFLLATCRTTIIDVATHLYHLTTRFRDPTPIFHIHLLCSALALFCRYRLLPHVSTPVYRCSWNTNRYT
ncbi:hypothetical protein BDD12DRAFT_245518 [Trichophaea hybrida]|nr:hypothetical protein BDD12DRAFT_245518 [Trichophaea hybrida]